MSNNINKDEFQGMRVPVIILENTPVLPGITISFELTKNYNIMAAKHAITQDCPVVIRADFEDEENIVGLIANVRQIVKIDNKRIKVVVDVYKRVLLYDFAYHEKKYYAAGIEIIGDDYSVIAHEEKGMIQSILYLFDMYAGENGKNIEGFRRKLEEISTLEGLIDYIANMVPFNTEVKIELFKETNLRERYYKVVHYLDDEISIQRYRRDYQKRFKLKMDERQKEYYLQEQLKMIKEELGDGEEDEVEEYKLRCSNLNASDEIKEKITKEIRKLEKTASSSAEYAILRAYIETLLDLPWDKVSDENNDINNAKESLDKSHYGLEKVKERIIESLAVRELTDKSKAPILCLVGPPGTGKTSIARGIAEAVGRKYIRICLGGVRDEAEIRGHRKTYVGAMPGRLITALKKAEVSNPVILLDEIDKVSNDYKGDTFSALLEVLDPEQNKFFTDHYVEIPVDLSRVMFICTANTTQTIPEPLLDRMEIIEIAGYTQNEKHCIAKDFLIKKQREQNGLKASCLTIKEEVIDSIIQGYTREAGVRGLEKMIGRICRKSAKLYVSGERKKITVSKKNLTDFLGKERYTILPAAENDDVGIVRGLAWTRVGGDTLEIEVNTMRGKGNLELTGQMGEVMKESAMTALSYVKKASEKYDVPEDYFEKHDIHIHIPEGAVPKDGPSAGITMATAMLSAVIEKPVYSKVAMTGEITLRGRVFAIGGLKEKLLAAGNAGIEKVLVPLKNKKDILELEEEITNRLQIVYVDNMEQVISHAIKE